MQDDLMAFVALSRYAGERLDLVQAGGGNSSVKPGDGTMLIKASGFSLSELGPQAGYAVVDNARVLAVLDDAELRSLSDKHARDAHAGVLMRTAMAHETPRPSIETYLHALMDTFTLHTHPMVVNAVTCRPDWEAVLLDLFPDALLVPYETPGIELALVMKDRVTAYRQAHGLSPRLVFLQNHGLIVSADDAQTVRDLTEDVVGRLEEHLHVDMARYKLTSRLSALAAAVWPQRPIAYLSQDAELRRQVAALGSDRLTGHFCPDGLVFCGFRPVVLPDLADAAPLTAYQDAYGEPAKVVLHQDEVLFLAPNVRKAKEMEDVFKFHVMVLAMAGQAINRLPASELAYLAGWDAEKYRQKL